MFKHKLQQWGLRKNYKSKEVDKLLIRQYANGVVSRTWRKVEHATQNRHGNGPPSAVLARYSGASSAIAILQPSTSNEWLAVYEGLEAIRLYMTDTWSKIQISSFLENDSPAWVFDSVNAISRELRQGNNTDAFRLINRACELYTSKPLGDPKISAHMITLIIWLQLGYPDIASLIAGYSSKLVVKWPDKSHPGARVLLIMARMGPERVGFCRLLLDLYSMYCQNHQHPAVDAYFRGIHAFINHTLALKGSFDSSHASGQYLQRLVDPLDPKHTWMKL